MSMIYKQKEKRTIEVNLEPTVMEVVATAIYDGVFMTSQEVSEERLEKVGFTEELLSSYLKDIVLVRQMWVTGQLKPKQRDIARNLYVPAGVAQMLAAIGNVKVGPFEILLAPLSEEAVANINWNDLVDFSDVLVRMSQLLASSKNIINSPLDGDVEVMSLIVTTLTSFDTTLGVHCNSQEPHPVKQAFALMAGIKLANDQLEILYPAELSVSDYRGALRDVLSSKVDR